MPFNVQLDVPGDRYEREADAVADAVVSRSPSLRSLEWPTDVRLMAHELTHVVQQAKGLPASQPGGRGRLLVSLEDREAREELRRELVVAAGGDQGVAADIMTFLQVRP